jgi:outer membrane lipoprotein LolB
VTRNKGEPRPWSKRQLLLNARGLCFVWGAWALAGCASAPKPTEKLTENLTYGQSSGQASGQWSGRLALNVEGDSPSSFSSAFDLTGGVEAGQLLLLTPLGTTAARVLWQPEQARVEQGTQVRSYASLDQLLQALTGAALPSAALFAWMQGQSAEIDGWSADLSGWASGRISAQRLQPAPAARLRVILER